jgi:two-component system, NarL family, response regulator NreC
MQPLRRPEDGKRVASAVRILIADDHDLVRKGLISILGRSHPEWTVVAEASNGKEAIERGELLRPNVAILDLSMPDINGLKVAGRLLKSMPGIRILVLSMHTAAPILRQLKKTGVDAYIAKNEAPRMLVTAIERILAGEAFFASSSASRPVEKIESTEYVPAPFVLTPKELEVMRLLVLGQSNKELASELGMSVRTAESHHASILAKLRVDSVGEMVRVAIRDGVI